MARVLMLDPSRGGSARAAEEEDTLRPPSTRGGEVALLTADPELAGRAVAALCVRGYRVATAVGASALPGRLPNDVLVVDAGSDPGAVLTMLEVLARVPTAPAVVVVLRDGEDLRAVNRFGVGAIAIDVVDELLLEVVERARRLRRRPRL